MLYIIQNTVKFLSSNKLFLLKIGFLTLNSKEDVITSSYIIELLATAVTTEYAVIIIIIIIIDLSN